MAQQMTKSTENTRGTGEHAHHSDDGDGHDHHNHSPLKASAHATLHCLIGCYIGDVIGVTLGVALSLGTVATIALAVVFAYIAGFSLALTSVMRTMGFSLREAMRVVWLGEAISILAMEIAMNAIDYMIGGVQAASISQPVFWIGLAAAGPAGFLAAWPVNHWLLQKEIKTHH